jgi:hypothetical protein
MRYQQFASHAYCGATEPVYKMASQQENAFCVLRFEVSRSVIAVQREFRARLKKDIILVWCARLFSEGLLFVEAYKASFLERCQLLK